MATVQEVEKKLNAMSDPEFRKFCENYGGGFTSRKEIKQIVSEFLHNPERERLLCYLLGLKTEDEKRTEGIVTSAKMAAESPGAAKLSAKAAWFAAVVALGALVTTIIIALIRG